MSRSRSLRPATQLQLASSVARLPQSDPRCALITATQLNAIMALIAMSTTEVSA